MKNPDRNAQSERLKNIMRRSRADPHIAPDEPIPIIIRPWDNAPGSTERDCAYVYRHALTTVAEVKVSEQTNSASFQCRACIAHPSVDFVAVFEE